MTTWSIEEKKLSARGWDRINAAPDVNAPMSTDLNTEGVEALYYDIGSVVIVWSGADALLGKFTIEGSLEGSNYCMIRGLEFTIDALSGHQIFEIPIIAVRKIRIKYEANGTTTGSFNARYLLKSRI